MSAPRWAAWLLRRLAADERADDVVGDLEETHLRRVTRWGPVRAAVATAVEALDVARALAWSRFRSRRTLVAWVDFKLGVRMLARYPGLTVVGGIAMAFGVCVGTAGFEVIRQLASPVLPFEGGERVVGIRTTDVSTRRTEPRILQDFAIWRDEVRSVEELGAYRTIGRNVRVDQEAGTSAVIAETSAAAFRIAGVPALLGRVLTGADERADAPAVVVVGYDEWQTRLGGAEGVVGRSITLGDTPATVVGVMPEGYGFPIADFWVPFRLNPLHFEPLSSPPITVFGRLVPGATLEQAQTELTGLGERAARASPSTHANLRSRVMSFSRMMWEFPGFTSPELAGVNLFIVALIGLLAGNVALLMFARSAARQNELVVRSALGASRARIVGQLFAEALVLAGVSAAVGIGAARFVFRWGVGVTTALEGALPYWITPDLSGSAVAYGVILTLIGAGVAGVLPGLKATRELGRGLKESSAGGGGMRFGRAWTVAVVCQVALTVTFPAMTLFLWQDGRQQEVVGVEVPFGEYLVAHLEADGGARNREGGEAPPNPLNGRQVAAAAELERRLAEEPAVAGVTFANALPRTYLLWHQIELDAGAVEPALGDAHRVGSVEVRPEYFDVLGAGVLAGRSFDTRDVQNRAPVVIVDQQFVDRVLGGRSPLGRLVRYVRTELSREPTPDGPWYEIIGVVGDLGVRTGLGRGGIYHLAPSDAVPSFMIVHARGDVADFAPRLREIAAEVDPTLQLRDLETLDDVLDVDRGLYGYWIKFTGVLSGVALLLFVAGIYSVMSFTVSRRRREIGVRVALGADRRRVVSGVLRRPLAQVGAGIAGGVGIVAWMVSVGVSTAEQFGPAEYLLIAAYALLMACVCMAACFVPARRALAVEPREVLVAES